jgi:hypothetical protein
MPKGGARNRSGPQKDPNSGRSEAIGYKLTALPSEGYSNEVPEFPLPKMSIFRWEYEGERRFQEYDSRATEVFRERELALWSTVWTYPQACAWSMEPWRWNSVAMWTRIFVTCESSAATAADKGSLHRFADQIGLTPAGLRENGWAIARDEVAAKRDEPAVVAEDEDDPRNRLTVVTDGTGG